MQKQSRRWLTIGVLGVSSLIFVGMSMIPLLGGILNQQQTSTPSGASPTPSAAASDSPEVVQKEEEGYQLVVKRDPNNQTALQGLVESRLKLIRSGLRKPKDVIEPLQKLAKLNPNQPLYSILLAQSQQQAGDRNGAAETYRTVLAQQPTHVESLQGYVTLLIQEQRSTEALNVLQKTVATGKQMNQQQAGSADVPAIEILMGDVYLSQKRNDEAMILYKRLQKENPNDFRPIVAQGIVLKNQAKNKEAIALFESALTLAPADVKPKIQQLVASVQAPTPTGSAAPGVPPSVSSPASSSPTPQASPSP